MLSLYLQKERGKEKKTREEEEEEVFIVVVYQSFSVHSFKSKKKVRCSFSYFEFMISAHEENFLRRKQFLSEKIRNRFDTVRTTKATTTTKKK